jgi:hypothetical protein
MIVLYLRPYVQYKQAKDTSLTSLCFLVVAAHAATMMMADDPKNAHLKALDGAAERLILCKADLLDYDAIRRAVQGCQGVFHTASPVTDDPVSATATARSRPSSHPSAPRNGRS